MIHFIILRTPVVYMYESGGALRGVLQPSHGSFLNFLCVSITWSSLDGIQLRVGSSRISKITADHQTFVFGRPVGEFGNIDHKTIKNEPDASRPTTARRPACESAQGATASSRAQRQHPDQDWRSRSTAFCTKRFLAGKHSHPSPHRHHSTHHHHR
jgi:hypothetical protein